MLFGAKAELTPLKTGRITREWSVEPQLDTTSPMRITKGTTISEFIIKR